MGEKKYAELPFWTEYVSNDMEKTEIKISNVLEKIAGQPPVKPDGIHERMTVLRRAFNQTDAILKFASREF